jgi:hypothetical protein
LTQEKISVKYISFYKNDLIRSEAKSVCENF